MYSVRRQQEAAGLGSTRTNFTTITLFCGCVGLFCRNIGCLHKRDLAMHSVSKVVGRLLFGATTPCNTYPPLQHTATHATHCNTLQHTATHCSTLQHTATHCNTLQHIATHCNTLQHTSTHCNTLQHTATHCNTLQHTATHCNTL